MTGDLALTGLAEALLAAALLCWDVLVTNRWAVRATAWYYGLPVPGGQPRRPGWRDYALDLALGAWTWCLVLSWFFAPALAAAGTAATEVTALAVIVAKSVRARRARQ